MQTYDVIVLGAGGVGSAALYELSRRGIRALGIDRFHPPHDRGSTHGETRVIRMAYFEHPDYVPLLREAYRAWGELEAATGLALFHEVGLLEVGPPDGIVVPGVLRAAQQHSLRIEPLSAAEIENRWSGFRVAGDLVGVFERNAGYLLVEQCVEAQLQAAQENGAELLTGVIVEGWSTAGGAIQVNTNVGQFSAARLIVAAGPWSEALLRDAAPRLEVRRKSLFWFDAPDSRFDVASGFPVYLFELPAGVFYGFPRLDGRRMKVAEHSGGAVVVDPARVNRGMDADEQARVERFLAGHLPGVQRSVVDHAVCLYTMSPDEHFILGLHPANANVVFVAGLSGHGYKFTPVLGRALVELALDGGTQLPVDFLSPRRLAMR